MVKRGSFNHQWAMRGCRWAHTRHGEGRQGCAEKRVQTSIGSLAYVLLMERDHDTQGHIQRPSLHFSLTITPITTPNYIHHTVAPLSPTKSPPPDAVALLVGANPAKSPSPQSKGPGFNPQQDQKDRKKRFRGQSKEIKDNQKSEREKKAEKPS